MEVKERKIGFWIGTMIWVRDNQKIDYVLNKKTGYTQPINT